MSDQTSKNLWKIDALGAGLVLALGAGAYLFQVGPAWSRREQAIAQATELNTEQSNARELERKLYGLKEQLNVTQRAADKSELKLEPAAELNRRLASLTELCAACRLQVDSIESGVTTSHDRYATVALRVSGRGRFRSCAALLGRLRQEMPDVAVIGLDMSSVGLENGVSEPGSEPAAAFAFDLLWHTKPLERPAPSVKK